jgi:hypothetical protein
MPLSYVLPAILREDNLDLAAAYLRDYTARWDGAHFECFGVNEPNRITADDLIAVSMLTVFVPARAAREILDDDADKISKLLAAISPDVALTDPRGSELVADHSEAAKLWKLLRKPNIGPTIASKLMARKRPALIPVQDSVVRAAVGWTRGSNFWTGMRDLLLTGDDGAVLGRLRRIRAAAGIADRYTDLRTFDVVVWMAYHDNTATD